MINKSKLVIIGYGGHARSCIEAINSENKHEIIGYIDKKKSLDDNSLEYFGDDSCLENVKKFTDKAFICVGHIKSNEIRKTIYKNLKKLNFKLPTIVASNSYVSKKSNLGEGTIVMHNVLVNTNVSIGNNCIINSGSIIEHDTVIGDHNHISTSTIINGNVLIGDNNFIGSNSTINHNLKIGNDTIIPSMTRVDKNIK